VIRQALTSLARYRCLYVALSTSVSRKDVRESGRRRTGTRADDARLSHAIAYAISSAWDAVGDLFTLTGQDPRQVDGGAI
jgi:hypothetical protein